MPMESEFLDGGMMFNTETVMVNNRGLIGLGVRDGRKARGWSRDGGGGAAAGEESWKLLMRNVDDCCSRDSVVNI